MWKNILLVGIGGSLGSICRYGVGVLYKSWQWHTLPWATFTVNLLGSFIIGIVYGFLNRYPEMPKEYLLFVATGFCGGFTTFSSFAFENVSLLTEPHHASYALVYTVLSLFLGLLCVVSGIWITRLF